MSTGEATIHELRNHSGEVIERVARGETSTMIRAGVPVAQLRPISRPPLSASALLANRKQLPPVDPAALHADVDAIIDPSS